MEGWVLFFGWYGTGRWRAHCRLAVTFGYVALSRRRASNCLSTIARGKQEDGFARRKELSGSIDGEAKTQAGRFSIRWKRFAGTGTESRDEIPLGSNGEERQESNAVPGGWKIYCGRRGWKGAFVSRQKVGRRVGRATRRMREHKKSQNPHP